MFCFCRGKRSTSHCPFLFGLFTVQTYEWFVCINLRPKCRHQTDLMSRDFATDCHVAELVTLQSMSLLKIFCTPTAFSPQPTYLPSYLLEKSTEMWHQLSRRRRLSFSGKPWPACPIEYVLCVCVRTCAVGWFLKSQSALTSEHILLAKLTTRVDQQTVHKTKRRVSSKYMVAYLSRFPCLFHLAPTRTYTRY